MTWQRNDVIIAFVDARLAVRGFQAPDLVTSKVSITAPVARKKSHLMIAPTAVLGSWQLTQLGVSVAFVKHGGLDGEVSVKAPRLDATGRTIRPQRRPLVSVI